MKLILYPHGGSGNHGCEALVRSTAKITESDITLFSTLVGDDVKYNLDSISEVKCQFNRINPISLSYAIAWLKNRMLGDSQAFDQLALKVFISEAKRADAFLSIGGDNYCYGIPGHLLYMNKCLEKLHSPLVLWGCSIEPEAINCEMLNDLRRYNAIIARESLTRDALIRHGIKNVTLLPDPAFQLDTIFRPLPTGWAEGNTVGINISPMVMGLDRGDDMALRNYQRLIEFIINDTDMSVALIPHVVWPHNDDRKPLKYLYGMYKDSGRVVMIDDHPAEELKGYIARCRFMVAARTHASIAAYSSMVPTLVVGYSVKAKGIAKDIFGNYSNYVIPVQNLSSDNELTESFKWLLINELTIKKHLNHFMPIYSEKALDMKNVLEHVIKQR